MPTIAQGPDSSSVTAQAIGAARFREAGCIPWGPRRDGDTLTTGRVGRSVRCRAASSASVRATAPQNPPKG